MELQPWQTGLPPALALVALLLCLWSARGPLGRTGLAPGLLGLALSGLVLVRIFALPVLERHIYDGHEAEYWDLFRGERQPNRGGTVLYPAMQWLWWGLGRALPAWESLPLLFSALAGAVATLLLALAAARLAAGRVGWMVGLLVGLHPGHVAWSSSAYNVILPQLGAALLWWAVAVALPLQRPPAALGGVMGASLALVVATRMDAGPAAALPLLLLILDGSAPRRARLPLLPGLVVGGLVALGCAFPLLWPGEVPGAGERGLSWCLHRSWTWPFTPFDGLKGLLLLVGGLALLRERPSLALIAAVQVLGQHALMATFDDYGERHALAALPGLALLLAGGSAALIELGRGWGWGLLAAALAVQLQGLWELRQRYYAPEEGWAELVSSGEWAALPRWSLPEAKGSCRWINEDPRVADVPPLSHFNLIEPGPAGLCTRWCMDAMDWRWSSRGVSDRAERTRSLHSASPLAVVELAESGYSCVVMELGPRARCPSSAAEPDAPPGEHSPVP
jgi:hypothetical protein